MNPIQSIHLSPDQMVIHHNLGDGRACQSQWTRQTVGPASETQDEFLTRMASIIQDRVASTKEELARASNPQEERLKARRTRLLAEIHSAQAWLDIMLGDGEVEEELIDLQDELEAVENALGHPEPKEPAEAG